MVFSWSLSSGGMAQVSVSGFLLTNRRQRPPKFFRKPFANPDLSDGNACTSESCNKNLFWRSSLVVKFTRNVWNKNTTIKTNLRMNWYFHRCQILYFKNNVPHNAYKRWDNVNTNNQFNKIIIHLTDNFIFNSIQRSIIIHSLSMNH